MADDASELHDREVDEESVLRQAKAILAKRLARGTRITNAKDAQDLAILEFTNLEQEEFGCLFLDTRHQIIAFEILFRGTINRSNVYPRVIAKQALDLHAAAVVLCHNHPSGDPNPSQADIALTKQLTETLGLFDIRVLDHLIVGGATAYSLAEHGLL